MAAAINILTINDPEVLGNGFSKWKSQFLTVFAYFFQQDIFVSFVRFSGDLFSVFGKR